MRRERGHPDPGFLHDSAPGLDDQVAFLGDVERVYTVTSTPAAGRPTSHVGLVLCPSIAHELVKNYRREVLIARALGAAGFPVARLQYRGTGNSDGDPEDMTYESMRDDAVLVVDHLLSTTGATEIILLGSRFGSLVAASAATALGAPATAFLEPVLSVERYVKEGFRAKMIQGIGQGDSKSSGDLAAELAATGSIDVLGAPLFKRFCDSWAGKTLEEELVVPGPVLLMHLGRRLPKAGITTLSADLQGRGFRTTLGHADSDESWWYMDERELMQFGKTEGDGQEDEVEAQATPSLVAQVVDWVEAVAVA